MELNEPSSYPCFFNCLESSVIEWAVHGEALLVILYYFKQIII